VVAVVTPVVLVALLLLVVVLWYLAIRARQHSGLPWGDTVQSDVGGVLPVADMLVSHTYQLVGKPDYILRRSEGLIPVEVKPTRRAKKPYDSDLMQLMAYCVLVEECYGQRPPYGLLRYATHTFRVDYTASTRAEILAIITEIQHDRHHPDCPRSHQQVSRCRGCGFWAQCSQSLVPAEDV
jgi:CRISPR-associated exonuclease Cas4